MVTLDRIRLTGLLPESPAHAGLSHFKGCASAGPFHFCGSRSAYVNVKSARSIDARQGDIVGRVAALLCTDAAAALRLVFDPRFRRSAVRGGSRLSLE